MAEAWCTLPGWWGTSGGGPSAVPFFMYTTSSSRDVCQRQLHSVTFVVVSLLSSGEHASLLIRWVDWARIDITSCCECGRCSNSTMCR